MQSYFKDKDKLFKQRRLVGGSSYSNFSPGTLPVWTAGHQYTKGMTVMNEAEGNLYWCIQNHYADQVFDPLFWILIGGAGVALQDTWIQTGLITNLFSSEDWVDWSGTLSPTASQRGVLPLPALDNLKLVRVQMKWLSDTAVTFGPGDSFVLQGGYIIPNNAVVDDPSFTAIAAANNLGQWDQTDTPPFGSGYPYNDSGTLDIDLTGGRLFAIRGRTTEPVPGTITPSNGEAQVTCTFSIGPQ